MPACAVIRCGLCDVALPPPPWCRHLLEELLQHTSAHIVCLIRPKKGAEGAPLARLKSARLSARLPWFGNDRSALDGAGYAACEAPTAPFVGEGQGGKHGDGDECVALGGRVTVIAGDISKPRLDVTAGTWDTLASNVDAIIHNGTPRRLCVRMHRVSRLTLRRKR